MKITKDLIEKVVADQDLLYKSLHSCLSIPIIERICKKMMAGLKFHPICISTENLIIDGHHRYISSIIANFDLEVVNNYPKPSKWNEIDWNSVEFVEEDWDSPSKIIMLNKKDADYNNMTVEQIQSINS